MFARRKVSKYSQGDIPVQDTTRYPFFYFMVSRTRNLTQRRSRGGRNIAPSLLAAARSQNGSGVINTIHYRSAASLPVETSQDEADSRTLIKPTKNALLFEYGVGIPLTGGILRRAEIYC